MPRPSLVLCTLLLIGGCSSTAAISSSGSSSTTGGNPASGPSNGSSARGSNGASSSSLSSTSGRGMGSSGSGSSGQTSNGSTFGSSATTSSGSGTSTGTSSGTASTGTSGSAYDGGSTGLDNCQPPPSADAGSVFALVQGNTTFAVDLFAQLINDGGASNNLFISPYSVSSALAMTYAGAAGQTALEMMQTLNYPADGAAVAPAFGALDCQLTADGQGWDGGQLDIANTLFGDQTYTFQPSFLSLMQADFGAALQRVDFMNDPAGAEQDINAWVSQRTQGMIPELLKPGTVTPKDGIVLVNALYYQGRWQVPFLKNNTYTETFHVSPTQSVNVQMMSQAGFAPPSFPYVHANGFSALEMGILGSQVVVDFLLPDTVGGLPAFEASLTPQSLQSLWTTLAGQPVNVYLPKLSLDTAVNLKPTLISMGMETAFTPAADFSAMDSVDTPFYLLFVQHEAVLDLEEGGLSATGATAVGGATGGAATIGGMQPATFRADHPYLVIIRDSATGTILFEGQVTDPTQH